MRWGEKRRKDFPSPFLGRAFIPFSFSIVVTYVMLHFFHKFFLIKLLDLFWQSNMCHSCFRFASSVIYSSHELWLRWYVAPGVCVFDSSSRLTRICVIFSVLTFVHFFGSSPTSCLFLLLGVFFLFFRILFINDSFECSLNWLSNIVVEFT